MYKISYEQPQKFGTHARTHPRLQLFLLKRKIDHPAYVAVRFGVARTVRLALLQVLAQPEVPELLQLLLDGAQFGRRRPRRRLLSLTSHEHVLEVEATGRALHLVLERDHLLAASLLLLLRSQLSWCPHGHRKDGSVSGRDGQVELAHAPWDEVLHQRFRT